jgi:hypothetical protein
VTPTATGTSTAEVQSIVTHIPTITPSPTSLPVTLVVEGPVQAINGNIVIIYDIEIAVDPNDPMLGIIQIGDVVHVDGNLIVDGSQMVIIAVNIDIVNIEVNVNEGGETWRDPGDCSNPPPLWAPAHGWRARCEGAPPPGNSGGMGMGDSDDDDDD